MDALADAYLSDAASRVKSSTLRRYTDDWQALRSAFGRSNADTLSPLALTGWLSKWKAGPTTKLIRLRSLSAGFGWAVRVGLLANNPVKAVPRPKGKSRSREAVVSEDTHKRLMRHASPSFQQVLAVLWATGCRPGEAARISAENFDPVNAVAVLDEHKADKTGRPRLIFLPPDVCDMLKRRAERVMAGPLLRTEKGNPWTGRSITEIMQKVKRAAGVKAMAYGYRHAFCTQALTDGVPDSAVAALLGHSSTAMIHKHYSHVSQQAEFMRKMLAEVRKRS